LYELARKIIGSNKLIVIQSYLWPTEHGHGNKSDYHNESKFLASNQLIKSNK